jgi:hypothetical protein
MYLQTSCVAVSRHLEGAILLVLLAEIIMASDACVRNGDVNISPAIILKSARTTLFANPPVQAIWQIRDQRIHQWV